MKKLHLGTMSFGFDSKDEVTHQLATAFNMYLLSLVSPLLVAHDFRPAYEHVVLAHFRHVSTTGAPLATRHPWTMRYVFTCARRCPLPCPLQQCHKRRRFRDPPSFLSGRSRYRSMDRIRRPYARILGSRIELMTPVGQTIAFEMRGLFPFTSESKRMRIVVREVQTQETTFLQKGADVVMAKIV